MKSEPFDKAQGRKEKAESDEYCFLQILDCYIIFHDYSGLVIFNEFYYQGSLGLIKL